jgi:FkbM family methyltransferase
VGRISQTLRRWRERLRVQRVGRSLAGPRLLRHFADSYPDATFIEIGSHDGERHDDLGPFLLSLRPFVLSRSWTGVMVEPVPYLFERLRRNYGGLGRIALENAAIADRDGRVPFYHLAHVDDPERERLPQWYDALGSLSRDAVLAWRDAIPDIERRVVRTEVPCLSFESLCRKHDVRELDLLAIDTEGYDYEIIRTIDFAAHRPRLLVYEHGHLLAGDRERCVAQLERLGYQTMEEAFDTWCLDTGIDDRLTRAWRRLRPGIPGISVHDLRAKGSGGRDA